MVYIPSLGHKKPGERLHKLQYPAELGKVTRNVSKQAETDIEVVECICDQSLTIRSVWLIDREQKTLDIPNSSS